MRRLATIPLRVVRCLTTLAAVIALAASTSRARAQAVDSTHVDTLVSIVTGDHATCVNTLRGTSWCWGESTGGSTTRLDAFRGRPRDLASLIPWSMRACAAADDGGDWCRTPPGRVESCEQEFCLGRLPARAALPVYALSQVTTGSTHACALSTAGAAYCWGHDDMGQLGDGRFAPDPNASHGANSDVPVAVAGELRFSQLSAGEMATCGVVPREGAVYCWGYGQNGATGDSAAMHSCDGARPFPNTPCSSARPVRVLPESLPGDFRMVRELRFVRVSVGERLACAVSSEGEAWCWGGNGRCALGRCRAPDSPLAHRIAVPGRVVQVGTGALHACARTADGRVFCWGDNSRGQLGSRVSVNAGLNGEPPDYRDTSDATQGRAYKDRCPLGGRCSDAAVEVGPGRRWAALSVSLSHACAVSDDDGGVYCWGGGDRALFGAGARMEACDSRSASWSSSECQPKIVRVPGIPTLRSPRDLLAVFERPPRRFPLDGARVFVSRNSVIVRFPRDTARGWGWSGSTRDGYYPAYAWGVLVEALDGLHRFELAVHGERGKAREFASLDSLMAAGRASIGAAEIGGSYDTAGVSANVADGGVMLRLYDTRRGDRNLVTTLFGSRPAYVRVWSLHPEEPYSIDVDSVRVQYIGPPVATPSAAQVEADAARKRESEASHRSIADAIRVSGDQGDTIALAVGDSIAVDVERFDCHYDVCYVAPVSADSGWTTDDPGVASVHADGTTPGRYHVPSAMVVGHRVGRTRLVARGVRPDTATVGSYLRLQPSAVVVTPPVGRVRFTEHPDTVTLNTSYGVAVEVTGADGRPITDARVRLSVGPPGGPAVPMGSAFGRRTVYANGAPGVRRLVAAYGGRADTAYVVVRPEPR